ncbi:hypothetical protein LIS04_197 [Listeria phage LIS04]|nr:hypothetical protein LIS04_197 [Listeria phage LIS04]
MILLNEKRYMNSKRRDPDSVKLGIYEYVEKWAELMEPRLESGESMYEVAPVTAEEAGRSDLSTYSFGLAVYILWVHWKYGALLKRWYSGPYYR